MPIAFRIKSGEGVERRYTPVLEALPHLLDSGFLESISFINENPPPYILEISRDRKWGNWEEIGTIGGY